MKARSTALSAGRLLAAALWVGAGNLLLVSLTAAAPGTKLWEFVVAPWPSEPAIGSDGTVYLAGGSKLYAVDGVTGLERWRADLGATWASYPAVGPDGTVYVASTNFCAFNGATGQTLWQSSVSGSVLAIGAEGTVCVAGSKVYALDGATGARKWESGVSSTCLAIGVGGTVYVGSADARVYALDGVTGATLWSSDFDDPVSSLVLGADDSVYVGVVGERDYTSGAPSGMVCALDGATGARKWAVSGGRDVYTVGVDGSVYAAAWLRPVRDPALPYFVLCELDGATGTTKSWTAGENWLAGPALAADGTLYALGNWWPPWSPSSLTLCAAGTTEALENCASSAWCAGLPGAVPGIPPGPDYRSTPGVGPDGTVYVAGWSTLSAFCGNSASAAGSWPKSHRDAANSGSHQIGIGPPTIVSQSGSQTVLAGSRVVLAVLAGGARSLTYQWLRDGQPLSGSVASRMEIPAVKVEDAGTYQVRVTNPLGEWVSQPMVITVTARYPLSVPRFLGAEVARAVCTLRIAGQSGARYWLEISTNLTQWTKVAALTNATGTLESQHQGTPGQTRCFYRLEVQP